MNELDSRAEDAWLLLASLGVPGHLLPRRMADFHYAANSALRLGIQETSPFTVRRKTGITLHSLLLPIEFVNRFEICVSGVR